MRTPNDHDELTTRPPLNKSKRSDHNNNNNNNFTPLYTAIQTHPVVSRYQFEIQNQKASGKLSANLADVDDRLMTMKMVVLSATKSNPNANNGSIKNSLSSTSEYISSQR
jgi:hypothetical protein